MAQHIIFDCDGVLIDTEIVAAEVVTNWMQSEGVNVSAEEFIKVFTGKTFTDIIGILKAEGRMRADLDTVSIVPELDDEIRKQVRPIAGVQEMLESIPLPKSVVSNSAADYVAEALEKLNISHHFEGRIFSSEMVEKAKPSPMVYQLALDTIKIPKEQVITIEDSLTGVLASTGAGIRTLGFLGGSHIMDGHGEKLRNLGVFDLANSHKELSEKLGLVASY